MAHKMMVIKFVLITIFMQISTSNDGNVSSYPVSFYPMSFYPMSFYPMSFYPVLFTLGMQ